MVKTERPEWDENGDGRPRVLVENPDFGVGFAAERVLEAEGYNVAVCGGPEALRGHRCPLVAEGRCGLAEGADVIVHSLNPDRPEHAAVLRALRARHPETPLVVEVPSPALVRHTALLEGCTIMEMPVTRDKLVSTVASSLDRAPRRTSPERAAVREPFLVGDGDIVTCERCGAEHTVFTINGEPRLQVVQCGTRMLPVGLENQRFTRRRSSRRSCRVDER